MEENRTERKQKDDNYLMSWIKTIVLALTLAYLIRTFIFNTTLVKGSSMHPTLEPENRLICLVFPLWYSDPVPGDIVVFDSPIEDKEYIKRVVGTPGDEVSIIEGKVYVNGNLYEEPWIDPTEVTLTEESNTWSLGEDQYFVMGDNRAPHMSTDSRYFGPIERKAIRSIAEFRYLPVSDFGVLP